MPKARRDTLTFISQSDSSDEITMSVIDAPQRFLDNVKARFVKDGYEVADHTIEEINLPRKYDRYFWLLIGGLSGSLVSAIMSALFFGANNA